MTVTRIFLHGLESSSKGTKARFLSEKYPDMLIPDFAGTLSERMEKLTEILNGFSDIILVGSSFGGLMATHYGLEYASRVRKIVLLAPAINFDSSLATSGTTIDVPTWIYIGKNDDTTPSNLVEPVARSLFTNLHYHLRDDDHLLHTTFSDLDWPRLLEKYDAIA